MKWPTKGPTFDNSIKKEQKPEILNPSTNLTAEFHKHEYNNNNFFFRLDKSKDGYIGVDPCSPLTFPVTQQKASTNTKH